MVFDSEPSICLHNVLFVGRPLNLEIAYDSLLEKVGIHEMATDDVLGFFPPAQLKYIQSAENRLKFMANEMWAEETE